MQGEQCMGTGMPASQSAYNINLVNGTKPATTGNKSTKAKATATMTENKPKEPTARECADIHEYALAHGLAHGGSTQQDAIPNRATPVLCEDSTDKNLLTFVQSLICRQKIWAHVFDNPHILGNTIIISAYTLVSLITSNSANSPVL